MRSRNTRPVPWSTSYFTRLPRGISMTASYAPMLVLLRNDGGMPPTSLSGADRTSRTWRDGHRYRGGVSEHRPGLDPAVADVRRAVRRSLGGIEEGSTVIVGLS